MAAALPLIVLLTMVASVNVALFIPPPLLKNDVTVLSLIVLPLTISVPLLTIPAPLASALLPLIVLLVIVRLSGAPKIEPVLMSPPPL